VAFLLPVLLSIACSHLVLAAAAAEVQNPVLTQEGAVPMALYPRAQLVDSAEEQTPSNHRVMLGALEKNNGEITPEASRYVQGIRSRHTYLVADEQRTSLVFDFYVEQLQRLGQVLFQCGGRECGSSNYWANGVFERRILYGPEQFQHYIVGLVEGHYLAIYVAQRATGQVYVHIDAIKDELSNTSQPLTLDAYGFLLALRSTTGSRLDLVPSESVKIMVVNALKSDLTLNLYIVGHDALRSGETVAQAIQRSEANAKDFQLTLLRAGIEPSRVQVFGVGPLAPAVDGSVAAGRLMLVRAR
jgi:hypothetical protein